MAPYTATSFSSSVCFSAFACVGLGAVQTSPSLFLSRR
uniref:Uncharacterized protein n=1 Tax=Anguilla anguilla TaxID=7936 RepID=A0A0E9XCQ7_ANGAN